MERLLERQSTSREHGRKTSATKNPRGNTDICPHINSIIRCATRHALKLEGLNAKQTGPSLAWRHLVVDLSNAKEREGRLFL